MPRGTSDVGVPILAQLAGMVIASGCSNQSSIEHKKDIRLAIDASTTRSRVEILDLFRALAVIAVLAFHYSFRGAVGGDGFTQTSLPELAPYAKYGFLGVQLFFVISGFVIAYSTERRTPIEFGIARIIRIYPTFLVCMTLTFLLTLAIGAPQFETGFVQWLANYAIAAPALKQPFMDGAYWSLVYEITFYTWVAALMMLGWFRRHVAIIVIIWMALAVANRELHSFALQHVFLTDESGFFAAGLVIYEIYCGRRDLTVKMLLILTTVTAMSQSVYTTEWYRIHFNSPYNDWVAASISLLAIASVGVAIHIRRLPFPSHVAVGIGGMTYPLYLIHQNIGYMIFNKFSGIIPTWLLIVMTASGMVLAAWSIWRFVERPGQRLVKQLVLYVTSQLRQPIAIGIFTRLGRP